MDTNKMEWPKVYFEGEEYPYHQYLIDIGGSGQLYDDHIKEVLDRWKEADWAFVYDYIGHIAAQVIIDASELDQESYNEIMKVVVRAYSKLKQRHLIEYEESEVKFRRESLHVVKK